MKLKLGKYARIINLPMFIDNNCELMSITLFGIEERHDHNEKPDEPLHDHVNVPEPALSHASYREILP